VSFLKLSLTAIVLLLGTATQSRAASLVGQSLSAPELGTVELTQAQDGSLVGRLKSASPCGFASGETVLTASLEGDMLVGKIRACLAKAECAKTQWIPYLALVGTAPSSLSGWMHVDDRCETEQFRNGKRLVLTAVSNERTKPAPLKGSAEGLVKNVKTEEELRRTFAAAQTRFDEKKYFEAQSLFKEVLAAAPQHFAARVGFAESLLGQNQFEPALQSFSEALRLARVQRVKPADHALVAFNMARAYSRLGKKPEALAALQQAVKTGGAKMFVDTLPAAEDLKGLHETVEYRRLAADVQTTAKRAP
jgi:Tetratricopeptide repeat